MHFSGLSGMPRRIFDYPDAFAGWNYISSIGSFLVGFSALFFFYIVFRIFYDKRPAGMNPWGDGTNTLEWTLPSPPAFHTYEELPKIS
jgi:heme/copper-type cytochrome/quinol oxidase subunit 1